jgi:hypothetical protein
MYCHACGIALTQPTKYCPRCGAQLIVQDQTGEVQPSEKRLDEYLDGLFWITFFGIGFIFAGLVVMKKIGLGDLFILAYLLISSIAFLINFGLNLWGALRIFRASREQKAINQRQTGQLDATTPRAALEPVPSVTEHTTRSFEPVPVQTKTNPQITQIKK